MKIPLLASVLILAGCNDRPPAPTAAENAQLDEAAEMLDEEAADEKGPASELADP